MSSGCCLCVRGPKISYQNLGSSETRNCVCGNAAVQVNLKFLPKGYSRDISFLETVVDIIKELKKANPSLVYGECQIGFSILKSELFFKPHFLNFFFPVCDPVMGDQGAMVSSYPHTSSC